MEIIIPEGVDPESFAYTITELRTSNVISKWHQSLSDIERHESFMSLSDGRNYIDIQLDIDKKVSVNERVSPRTICTKLRSITTLDLDIQWSYSIITSESWWVAIRVYGSTYEKVRVILKSIVSKCILKGVEGVTDFHLSTKTMYDITNGSPVEVQKPVVFTKGSNLKDLFRRNDVDIQWTTTNDIREIDILYGIDAACKAIEVEWVKVMRQNDVHVGTRHIELIAAVMCFRGFICPINYQGICKEDTSITKKASFEKVMESFVKGAVMSQKDDTTGVVDSICWNRRFNGGTGGVDVFHEPEQITYPINTFRKKASYKAPSEVSILGFFSSNDITITTKTLTEHEWKTEDVFLFKPWSPV